MSQIKKDKYILLYEELKSLGVDESKIDELIEQIEGLANVIIDIFIKKDEIKRSNLQQSINK